MDQLIAQIFIGLGVISFPTVAAIFALRERRR